MSTIISLFSHLDRQQSVLVAISSAAVAGVGLFALRRYSAGGDCKSKAKLDGKTVIITGANAGIGRETAIDLARRGARVILACRDASRAEKAEDEIRKETGSENVVVRIVDLASLESVRKFCRTILETENRLDILINNAGHGNCPKWKTKDGFEYQFGVNHLSHFLLTNLLLDLLKKSAPSRIINVSSIAHRKGVINFDDINSERGYSGMAAYRQSKLANVFFTKELHNRLKGTGVSVFSLHPGVIWTGVFSNSPLWAHLLMRLLRPVLRITFKTEKEGAQTTIHCAVAEGLERQSGQYFIDCAIHKSNPLADDDAAIKRFWNLSSEMVGLENND